MPMVGSRNDDGVDVVALEQTAMVAVDVGRGAIGGAKFGGTNGVDVAHGDDLAERRQHAGIANRRRELLATAAAADEPQPQPTLPTGIDPARCDRRNAGSGGDEERASGKN